MNMRTGLVAIALLAGCKDKPSAREIVREAPRDPDTVVAELEDASIDAGPAKPVRPEHGVWRLVDNRHTAHRGVGGELVLDARTIGFARYTRFGVPFSRWTYGATVAGERAALASKLATLEVPIIPEQTPPTQVTMRVHAQADKQTLELRVNGQKLKAARVPLEPGWQTIAFAVEPGRIVPGENNLGLETIGRSKDKVGVAWVRIGATHPPADHDPLADAAFDTDGEAIELAEHASLTWYVTVPEGAHFVATVGGACHIEVGARAGDASYVGGLVGSDQDRVDLSSIAGKTVRLSLTARECPRARIVRPRITVHGPEPEPLPPAEPPRYVLLWIMDALRADKLPIFTPGARAQTPNFDELAKSSVVFRQYYVQGNESQTSHSSMWTSLYPAVHGVRTAGVGGVTRVSPKLPILGDALKAAGLYTAAVTGNGFVNEGNGYARGFREYRNMMQENAGYPNGVIYGQTIVDAMLARLDKLREQSTFMFMGTIDTHGPWIARKPWIDTYSPGKYSGPFQTHGTAKHLGFQRGRMGCSIIPPPADIERLRAIYDSAVSYTDQQLGRVIDQLKSWGIWDQTMLIITADHGEEFFEDTRCGHGGSLRDSLVRVPLLVRDPPRFPGGTIVDEGVDGVDVLPSILDALDQPPIAEAQGASLVPLAQGIGRGWPRPSYASMYEYAHAMRVGRWKIRVGPTGAALVGDMVDDPGETKDVSAIRPIERRMLTDALGLFLATRKLWKKSEWGVVTNITAAGAAALDAVAP
jgi:choline-sulfatase